MGEKKDFERKNSFFTFSNNGFWSVFHFRFERNTKALRFWGLGRGHPRTRSNLLSSILPPNVTTPSWISLTGDMMKNDERWPRVLLLSFWNGTPCISSWCGKSAYIRGSVGVGFSKFYVKSILVNRAHLEFWVCRICPNGLFWHSILAQFTKIDFT